MTPIDQSWFEMQTIRQRKLTSAVWIPLRASSTLEQDGQFGFLGFKEEFFGAVTLAVPLAAKEIVTELTWNDIRIAHQHGPSIDEGSYLASDVYDLRRGGFNGLHLVLEQRTNRQETTEWHLNQDLALALGLKREGDTWVRPNESYVEVVKQHRHPDGSPSIIETRAEHLRDYLCARDMGLYLTSYRSRTAVVADTGQIGWPALRIQEQDDDQRWEGCVYEIHEGGRPFGQKTAIFRAARTDVDQDADVPSFGNPTNESVTSESWTVTHQGKQLFVIKGELWRKDWLEPAGASPRVRGDALPATVYFIGDAAGTRENSETLRSGGKWLWFRPDVVTSLAHRRGGGLAWYTRDTGSVWCSPDYAVHFGVNPIGLINVYAKDIAILPEWQQKIWGGHNIGPDGGVCEELLASQIRAEPATTQAPESFLAKSVELLRTKTKAVFGVPLIRPHAQGPAICEHCHRFRAIDMPGLFALAKDLARLTADSIDTAEIHKLLSFQKGDKTGSLKSLERLLATKVGPEIARQRLGPLVGIYELRLADAHLPGSEISDSFALVGIDIKAPPVHRGFQMIDACVSSIYRIANDFESKT